MGDLPDDSGRIAVGVIDGLNIAGESLFTIVGLILFLRKYQLALAIGFWPGKHDAIPSSHDATLNHDGFSIYIIRQTLGRNVMDSLPVIGSADPRGDKERSQ